MPKEKETPSTEPQETSPINIELKNEAGVFRFKLNKQEDDYLTVVEIENNQGEKVVLNDFLPEGYRVLAFWGNEGQGTFHIFEYKIIVLEMNTAKKEGWKYLLSILHEIGHAVISQSSEEERQKSKERDFLRAQSVIFEGNKLKQIVSKYEKMQSENERNAWAYAVREFKKILNELKIDAKTIFASNTEMRDYFNELLLSGKEGGREFVEGAPLSDTDKQELLKEIDKLYTRKKVE